MAELRSAYRVLVLERIGGVPEVRYTMLAGFMDLHDIGAPEFGIRRRIGEPDGYEFAGNAVAHKNHPSFVAGNSMPTVGNIAQTNLEHK